MPEIIPHPDTPIDPLLSVETVCAVVGGKRSWLLKKVQLGKFPQPVRIGVRFTRWRASEVREWVADPTAWIAAHAAQERAEAA